MFLLTSQEMRELDRLSLSRDGIPASKLMQNAGREAAKVFFKHYKKTRNQFVLIFCGPGNNGGDGKVVARLMSRKRISHQIVRSESDLKKTRKKPTHIIDALFGTGLSRPITGPFAELIDWINKQNVPVLSLDIPSGLNTDTGEILGACVKATHTVSFGFPKRGFYFKDGLDCTGEIHVVDIGLSPKAIAELSPKTFLIAPENICPFLAPRKKDTHKGTYGHVFTIAGSMGKIGAGVMAAYAALQAGCGLSTLILPYDAYDRIDVRALELMFEPVGTKDTICFAKEHLSQIFKLIGNATVVALGPGLGTHPDTVCFVQEIIRQYTGTLILDADGLNAVAQDVSILKQNKGKLFLTPHPGEMARLTKKTTAEVQADRLNTVMNFAKEFGVTVLLKGYRSLIGLPDGAVWVNPTGGPAMASAGQGDVLTGIEAGLMAQYPGDPHVFLFGAYLHGLVGDLLAEKGRRVVLATDIAKNLDLGYSFLTTC